MRRRLLRAAVLGDVLVDDTVDGTVSLQLVQSLVDLLQQSGVALVHADGVVLNGVLVVTGEDVDALGGNALSTSDSSKVIALLCASPNGVQTMSAEIPGLVQTSLNLGVLKKAEDPSLITTQEVSDALGGVEISEKVLENARDMKNQAMALKAKNCQ